MKFHTCFTLPGPTWWIPWFWDVGYLAMFLLFLQGLGVWSGSNLWIGRGPFIAAGRPQCFELLVSDSVDQSTALEKNIYTKNIDMEHPKVCYFPVANSSFLPVKFAFSNPTLAVFMFVVKRHFQPSVLLCWGSMPWRFPTCRCLLRLWAAGLK